MTQCVNRTGVTEGYMDAREVFGDPLWGLIDACEGEITIADDLAMLGL